MLISDFFETIRVSAVGQYPIFFQKINEKTMKKIWKIWKKKPSRYRVAVDKMCLSCTFYSKFQCFDS
jgi:hypothetical protein